MTDPTPLPSAIDTADLIRRGEVSAREIVTTCLERLGAHPPTLNAVVHVDAGAALAAADRVDAARLAGDDLPPLAGVPFGVKDLEDSVGMPTTRGSRWYADAAAATRDDIHVARFRAAGAIPIGKTATPEFGAWGYTASPLLDVTRNPWNPQCTPGGSSGGTAAAVSAGVVPFGTASDGGGSIRGPGSSCGLPGLKPTYGRVPTFGVTRHAQNAVNFALATTMADTALLLGWCHHIVAAGLHDQQWVAENVSGFAELKQHLEKYPVEKVAEITGIANHASEAGLPMHPDDVLIGNNDSIEQLGYNVRQCLRRMEDDGLY